MKIRIKLILTALFLTLSSFIYAGETPNLKVGILSDIHVSNEKSKETFIKALDYFRNNDVDAVMIAGDLVEMGMDSELQMVADAWYEVFPKDKGLKGKKITKLFVTGNHDIRGHTYQTVKKHFTDEEIQQHNISANKEILWKQLFKEEYQPIYIKEVNGYTFIGANFVNVKNIPGLESFFVTHKDQIPADKPVFYFQHVHPAGTCMSSSNSVDDGKSTELLKQYPNLICFSGHSHTSLTDERTIWQGEFTSVGTGSLKYTTLISDGHENGALPKDQNSQMVRINHNDAGHGMIMSVFNDRVELLRHEIKNDEDLGTWIIPLDVKNRPYSFERRAEEVPAPEFAAKSSVRVSMKENGKDRQKNPVRQMNVFFPGIASSDAGPRAFDFEVNVETMSQDTPVVILTKKVFSRGAHLGELIDNESKSHCTFAISELPAGVPFRFAVYPMNCFGRKGKPIYSTVMTL